MKGTAILLKNDADVKFVENLDQRAYEEIKEQCHCDHCNCHVEKDRVVDFGNVSMIGWKSDEIDWDYGY